MDEAIFGGSRLYLGARGYIWGLEAIFGGSRLYLGVRVKGWTRLYLGARGYIWGIEAIFGVCVGSDRCPEPVLISSCLQETGRARPMFD